MIRAKRKRRLRWPTIYAVCTATTTIFVLLAIWAATCRPAWYTPAAVDRIRLKCDKADFANLLDRIGAALNAGEPIEFEISADQLNRWFAARGEIWPTLQFELRGLGGVQINFVDDGVVRLAGAVTRGPLSVVLSALARCRAEPAELVVELESLHAGSLPIPGGKVLTPLREAIARSDSRTATMAGNTIRVKNRWIWKNGQRPFHLDRLEIVPGCARIRLAPA